MFSANVVFYLLFSGEWEQLLQVKRHVSVVSIFSVILLGGHFNRW